MSPAHLKPRLCLLSLITIGSFFLLCTAVFLVTRLVFLVELCLRSGSAFAPAPQFSAPSSLGTCLRRPPELNHNQRDISLFCVNAPAGQFDYSNYCSHVRLSHCERSETKQQREAGASRRGGCWKGTRRAPSCRNPTPPSPPPPASQVFHSLDNRKTNEWPFCSHLSSSDLLTMTSKRTRSRL